MTNKIFSKTLKKTTLMSVIIAIVLAAAIVVCALFGFNKDVTLKDSKTLTVSMNTFAYTNHKEDIVEECEKNFNKADLSYKVAGEMDGDVCEIVFVFDKDTDVATMKTTLQAIFDSRTATASDALEGASIEVSASTEVAVAVLAKHFVLRAAIACVLFAVLAIAYVAVRYRSLGVSLVVGGSVLVSMLLTAAILVLTRVFVTSAVAAVIATSGLLTAAMVLLTVGKAHGKKKEGSELSNEELVLSSLAAKEIVILAASLFVAMLVIGIVGKTAAAWFAVSAIVAVAVAALVSLFYAPAAYLSVLGYEAAKPVKDAYVGAKKTSKKEKKAFRPAKKEEPVAAPVEEPVAEETPVEESVEEEVSVEEAPVEEPVEETEVPAEETPVETTEE